MGKVTGLAHNVNYLEILCYLAGRWQAHFVGHSSYLTVQVVLLILQSDVTCGKPVEINPLIVKSVKVARVLETFVALCTICCRWLRVISVGLRMLVQPALIGFLKGISILQQNRWSFRLSHTWIRQNVLFKRILLVCDHRSVWDTVVLSIFKSALVATVFHRMDARVVFYWIKAIVSLSILHLQVEVLNNFIIEKIASLDPLSYLIDLSGLWTLNIASCQFQISFERLIPGSVVSNQVWCAHQIFLDF